MSQPIERHSEKFVKKLHWRTDLEYVLERLDTLTQKETQMASAQPRELTHTVGERGMVVAAKDVLGIRGQVARFVAGIDDKVSDNNNKIKALEDRIAELIRGAQTMFSRNLEKKNNLDAPRRTPCQTFVIILHQYSSLTLISFTKYYL